MLVRTVTALAAVAALSGGQPQPQGTVEKSFAAGGHIQLRLEAADYRISGAPDAKIRVSWRVEHPEDTARVAAEVQVTGTTAAVVTRSPKNGVHFTIEVPQRSDIAVDLSAGDLEVRGIEGSKSVSSWAGDILIDVGKPDQYRHVDATVRFGDLSAQPFGFATGGVWRSFTWSGPGKYSLKVRLFAGDLTFR